MKPQRYAIVKSGSSIVRRVQGNRMLLLASSMLLASELESQRAPERVALSSKHAASRKVASGWDRFDYTHRGDSGSTDSLYRGPSDAWLHAGSSAAIQLMGYGGLRALDVRRREATAFSVAVTLLAGIGKEVYDARSGGDPSLRDLFWDVVGMSAGLTIARVSDR